MKRAGKIIGIIVIGLTLFLCNQVKTARAANESAYNFKFINTGKFTAEIIFYDNNIKKPVRGKTKPRYKFILKPGITKREAIHGGVYQYYVYHMKSGRYLRHVSGLALGRNIKNRYRHIYIDAPGYKKIVLVNISAFFSKHRHIPEPYIKKIYPGNRPFMIPSVIQLKGRVVEYGEAFPQSSSNPYVYAIVPVSGKIRNKNDAQIEIKKYLKGKLK